MRKQPFALMGLIALSALLAVTPAAHADTLSLTLSNPYQYGVAGTTFSFFATVSAPITNSGTEYLNGDSFKIGLPATLDDTAYQSTFALSVDPGTSFTGLLFTVTLPNSALMVPDFGTFTITGGSTDSTFANLATANFSVTATPEPSSFVMLGTGLLGITATLRRKIGLAR